MAVDCDLICQIYLSQNIFKIPPHVILDEDTAWKEQPTESSSSLRQCEDEIQTLTDKLTAVLDSHIFVDLRHIVVPSFKTDINVFSILHLLSK